MNILYLQDHIDFTLNEKETLSSLGLKSAQNLESEYILKTLHIKHNCKDRLIVDITDKEPLTSVYKGLSDSKIIDILKAFAEVFELVSSKAFLEREFILMDIDYLYIDRNDSSPRFIILPYTNADGASIKDWSSQVVGTVATLLYGRENLIKGSLAKLSNAIDDIRNLPDDNVLELINAKKKVVDVLIEIFPKESRTSSVRTGDNTSVSNNFALRYRGSLGEFAFYIMKADFYIGKNQDMDGVLSFNPAVSRKHAVIHTIEGKGYIEDLGSSNGTFLNGSRCESGTKYILHERDIVKIADMEFTVEM
ncbi:MULTISPECIES: FHA domain-containing protein [unclassified Butyrivibrio]|uniref:FHA domain-containing protein n=1 Tax=unclassified Butyrivibrio TaxID=2639466 RepID=UPI000423C351|nr:MULTISPECIES: FHA domain-containing protein [unclassified Butyrivibrio]SCY47226.1 FHA domain protein [Butyrivibrio sp. INlla14]